MWARVSELLLAAWLLISRFVFSYENFAPFLYWSDFLTALSIALFAALSFFRSLDKFYLAELLPIGWLFYVSYSYPTPLLPFALQNYVVIALLLITFIFIPSRASDSPRRWQEFLKGKEL